MQKIFKKSLKILFIFFGAIQIIFASPTDSLIKSLPKTPETKRASIHLEISQNYLYENPAKSKKHSLLALELAEKFGLEYEKADAFRMLGFYYLLSHDYLNAITSFRKSLLIEENIGRTSNLAELYNNIGVMYNEIGSDYALFYLEKAKSSYKKLNDTLNEFSAINNIGNFYNSKGEYSKALTYFISVLKNAEKNNNTGLLAVSYNNIANIYELIGNYDKAIELYKSALNIYAASNKLEEMSKIYNNIGIIYAKLKKYPKSLEYHYNSLKIKQKQNNPKGMAITLNNIADNFEKMTKFDSALANYEKSGRRFAEAGYNYGVALSYANMGNIFVIKNRLDSANYYLNKCIEISQKENFLDILKDANLYMYKMYFSAGKTKQALFCYQTYSDLKDTLSNRENQRNISELLFKYNAEKNEKNLQILLQDNKIANLELRENRILIYFLILSIIFIALIIVVVLGKLRMKNKLEKDLNSRNKELERYSYELENEIDYRISIEKDLSIAKEELSKALSSEKELNELKTRFISMVSHEYRTPLTVILSSTYLIDKILENNLVPDYKKHSERIKKSVDSMIKLLNDVLILGRSEKTRSQLSLKPHVINDIINDAINEQEMIDEHAHKFIFDNGDKQVNCLIDYNVCKQILTNLISNAVKYSPPESYINIELKEFDQFIQLSVSDTGIGIPEKEQKHLFEPFHRFANVGNVSGTGLGLAIVKMYVEILNGQIRVESKENVGTRITITTPKKI